MAANSWNLELDMPSGHTLKPVTFGEFSEGQEGMLDVADGEKKYKVRDQIFAVGEIPFSIYIKRDKVDFRECQDAVKGGEAGDYFARWVDPQGNTQLTYLLKNCQMTFGNKNAFDRNSKSADMKTYNLLPEDIEEIQ